MAGDGDKIDTEVLPVFCLIESEPRIAPFLFTVSSATQVPDRGASKGFAELSMVVVVPPPPPFSLQVPDQCPERMGVLQGDNVTAAAFAIAPARDSAAPWTVAPAWATATAAGNSNATASTTAAPARNVLCFVNVSNMTSPARSLLSPVTPRSGNADP